MHRLLIAAAILIGVAAPAAGASASIAWTVTPAVQPMPLPPQPNPAPHGTFCPAQLWFYQCPPPPCPHGCSGSWLSARPLPKKGIDPKKVIQPAPKK